MRPAKKEHTAGPSPKNATLIWMLFDGRHVAAK